MRSVAGRARVGAVDAGLGGNQRAAAQPLGIEARRYITNGDNPVVAGRDVLLTFPDFAERGGGP